MPATARFYTITLLCILTLEGCATAPVAPAPPSPAAGAAGDATVIAVSVPQGQCATLPEFLGLSGLGSGIHGACTSLRSRLGMRFPGLEPQAPLLTITDPANQGEDATPEVQAAAKQKEEKEKAAQKIKAIRYLTSETGCGKCYPETEKAIVSSLQDCIEAVRFETVKGLRKQITCKCVGCRNDCCCTDPILEQLHKMANDTDCHGCPVEQSARVRRLARIVLCKCGGYVPIEEPPEEEEAEPDEPAEEGPANAEVDEGPPEESPDTGDDASQDEVDKEA